MMSRSAVDCLRRAGLSLRANWGLVWLSLLQSVVVGVLFVVSLVPPFLVLGGMALLDREWTAAAAEEWLLGLGAALAGQLVPLALAIVASLLLGFLAVLVWGWFQGGIFGTLVAAERQALPDAQNRAGGASWFRTFSLPEFTGWGGRYAWRFFWFFHLSLTIGLLLMLVAVLIVFGVVLGYETWGGGAAYGIGCGAALPFLFVLFVYALWSVTAQPFLAKPGCGVMRAAGDGLRVIGRRPGAVLLIVLTLLVLGVGLAITLWVGELSIGLLVESRFAAGIVLFALFAVVRMVINAALGVFASAAFTSLAVAEAPEGAR